jgi:hypothetical protein
MNQQSLVLKYTNVDLEKDLVMMNVLDDNSMSGDAVMAQNETCHPMFDVIVEV